MNENRFTRVYQEYKREQEQQRFENDQYNRNRFACLVEDRLPPVRNQDGGRFGCLLDNYSKPYTNYSPSYSNATYISRPRPEVKPLPPVKVPTPPPPMTFDSAYHFPDLVKKTEEKPKPKVDEEKPKLQKAVIISQVKIKKEPTFTSISIKDGKYVQKDLYEDGTYVDNDEEDKAPIVIKKPIYSSWASVLKPKINQVVYYEED